MAEQSEQNKLYMDNVHSISLEATNLIEKRLAEFGIKLNEKQIDIFYVMMETTIIITELRRKI